jgi:hypothetical protein
MRSSLCRQAIGGKVPEVLRESGGGVPPMVEKRAEAGSRDGILCGGHDRLVDHLLLEW